MGFLGQHWRDQVAPGSHPPKMGTKVRGREGRPTPPHEGSLRLPTSPLVDRPRGTHFAWRTMVHHRPRGRFQKPTLSRYFLYSDMKRTILSAVSLPLIM